MCKKTKILLAIAACLGVLGMIIFAAAMSAYDWDFTKLSTVKYETNSYALSEAFCDISINTDTADIVFAPSDTDKCKVVCYEPENAKHTVGVREGSLTINIADERKWYEYIGITMGTPKVTVYLPAGEYASLLIKESTGDVEIPNDFQFKSVDVLTSTGDVKNYASASEIIKIKTSTGDIYVENISAGGMDLSVSTGKVTASNVVCGGDVKISVNTGKTSLTDVACKAVISSGDTGAITLKNVVAEESLVIDRDTGDVKFEDCDGAEIYVETDTGDVTGSFLSDKVFIAESDTGRVDVPRTTYGGKCEISTDTGDIKIKISQ